MYASDLIWNEFEPITRGEALEVFSDALLAVMTNKEICGGNGDAVDAVESALNILCKEPNRLKRLNKWMKNQ